MPDQLSIQERLYPHLTCFGCGHANPKGLHLCSYPTGDFVTARFTPWPEHDNGFGFVNGGIIATLLDCHSGAAVFDDTDLRGPATEDPALYVTAGLDVRYLRPTPLAAESELRAVITSREPDEVLVAVELLVDDKPRASALARWRRWRPR